MRDVGSRSEIVNGETNAFDLACGITIQQSSRHLAVSMESLRDDSGRFIQRRVHPKLHSILRELMARVDGWIVQDLRSRAAGTLLFRVHDPNPKLLCSASHFRLSATFV